MLNPWLPSQKLRWNSDFNGYEVGYEDVSVVGVYSIENDIDMYINMENMQILEIFCCKEHEEE